MWLSWKYSSKTSNKKEGTTVLFQSLIDASKCIAERTETWREGCQHDCVARVFNQSSGDGGEEAQHDRTEAERKLQPICIRL